MAQPRFTEKFRRLAYGRDWSWYMSDADPYVLTDIDQDELTFVGLGRRWTIWVNPADNVVMVMDEQHEHDYPIHPCKPIEIGLAHPKPMILRRYCLRCSSFCPLGWRVPNGFQQRVNCWRCSQYQYFARRVETGEPPRKIASRSPVPPKIRQAVFRRDHYTCVLCRRPAEPGNPLEIGHLFSVDTCNKAGVDSKLRDDPANLAAMCKECNLGLGKQDVPRDVIERILFQRDN